MKEKILPYDPAESLTTPEAIEYFVRDAMQDDDASYIVHALGIAARAKGMTKVANDTGLAREARLTAELDQARGHSLGTRRRRSAAGAHG